jgi:2-iminoacetate synthase ThiH
MVPVATDLVGQSATEQFSIADERSPAEVVVALQMRGFEAVWKDWDAAIGASLGLATSEAPVA